MPGRGKPKGLPKSGGRQKGGVGKIKREAEIAAKGGVAPLDFMLGVLADEKKPFEERKWAAAAAAPYVHPKLQAMTLGGDPDKPLKVESMSEVEMARRLAFILTTGTP